MLPCNYGLTIRMKITLNFLDARFNCSSIMDYKAADEIVWYL